METETIDLRGKCVQADYIFMDGVFKADLQLEIDNQGRIARIGQQLTDQPIKLNHQVLLPGMVNAHSHAFHRGMRGRSHIGQSGADSFWGWRNDMYRYSMQLDKQTLYDVCCQAFSEMKRSGITTVGEFHYLHHLQAENRDYELDKVVLAAAKHVNIRIVLLLTYYEQSGLNSTTLEPAQKRFVSNNLPEFWRNFDALQNCVVDTQTLGVAAHSIRAVKTENMESLRKESLRRGIPFHMHLEEQPKEISDCEEALKMSPANYVLDKLEPNESFTGVHCSFTEKQQLNTLMRRAANICVCPLTEGCLGDGIPALPDNADVINNLCLGTDCNNRICMAEEMRWMAYTQHLKNNERGHGAFTAHAANGLFHTATVGGARALALQTQAGKIKEGYVADFFTLDLTKMGLKSDDDKAICSQLLDAFVFGYSSAEVIKSTAVAGKLNVFY